MQAIPAVPGGVEPDTRSPSRFAADPRSDSGLPGQFRGRVARPIGAFEESGDRESPVTVPPDYVAFVHEGLSRRHATTITVAVSCLLPLAERILNFCASVVRKPCPGCFNSTC